MARRKVVFGIDADPSGFRKGVNEAESVLGKFGKGIAAGLGVGAGLVAFDKLKDAALGTARAFVELAERGAEVSRISGAYSQIVSDYENVLNRTRSATQGLVSDLDLMKAANKAALLGLPLTADSMSTMAEAATVLGRAMGQDATKSLDDLTTALGRSSPLILDNLGLTVKVGEANKQYAAELHKSVNELTDAEKKMAFYNAAMDAAKKKVAEIGGVQLTLTDRFQKGKVAIGNILDSFGELIAESPELNRMLGDAVEGLEDLAKWAEKNKDSLAKMVEDGLRPLGDALEGIKVSFRELKSAGSIISSIVNPLTTPAALKALTYLAQLAGPRGMLNAAAYATGGAGGLGAVTGFGQLTGIGAAERRAANAGITTGPMPLSGLELSKEVAQGLAAAREARLRAIDEQTTAARDAAKAWREGFEEGLNPKMSAAELGKRVRESFRFLEPELARSFAPGRTAGEADVLMPINTFWNSMDPTDIVPTAELQKVQKATIDWSDALQDLNNAFTLFGDPGRKLGAFAAGIISINQSLGLFKQGKAAGGFGGFLGQASGLLGVAGAGVNLVGGLVGGLFGGGEEREVNDLRDEFFGQWENGFIGLQQQLQGLTDQDLVKRIFDAETVEEFNAAVGEAMGLLDTQKAAQEALNDAAARYNFSIEEMGPAFRNQQLDQMAGQLLSDWELLNQAGFDQNAILREMGPGMQEYVTAALAAGAAIPEAMRGPIESLIEMGALTDAEGNPFTSLEESGLTFTETLSEGLSKLIDKLDEFLAALNGEIPTVRVPVEFDTSAANDNGFRRGDSFTPDQSFPSGGMVMPRADGRSLPDGHIPIFAKPGEYVLPPGALEALRGGGGGVQVSIGEIAIAQRGDPRELAAAVGKEVEARLLSALEQGDNPRIDAAVRGAVQRHSAA